MDAKKRAALERAGWKVGDVQELFDLSDEEMAIIEIRARLAQHVRQLRRAQKLTQAQLAARIGTSQPRIANVEKGDATIDALVQSLVALGATRKEIGEVVAEERAAG